MANVLSPYNPTFYAAEALIVLQSALGIANRVYRGYEAERTSYGLGESVQVRKPSDFSVETGGTSTTSDPYTTSQTITIDQWKQVKFALTDKELTQTGSRIIEEHIQPAAYALANNVDSALMSEYVNVPWLFGPNGDPGSAISDITGPRKILADNAGAQVDADDGNVHMAVTPTFEKNLLENTIFYQAQTAGGLANQEALLRGHLGTRYGVEVFRSHNVQQHASGTVVSASDQTGALNGAHTIGASTISVDGLNGTETLKPGDSFVIASDTQRYVVTTLATLSSGAHATVAIFPNLVAAYADDAVVTVAGGTAGENNDAFHGNMMFHRNAFGLVVGPLPEIGDGAGAQMSTVSDDQTGLSIRSRIAYDDDTAKVKVTLDILYGVKTLEPNLAVRVQENV